MDGAYLYIVKCSDGSFYVGTTRAALELRIAQHNAGTFAGYTETRRPVELVYSGWFDRITDAIEAERQAQGMEPSKERGLYSRRLFIAATTRQAQDRVR